MIAIIPVRFSDHDDVRSRQPFDNWMQPLRPNGLANFWWRYAR
jgi:hypothetical protein